jgi:hypothetical protein
LPLHSGPDNPPIGYHRWHAIVRATIMVGIDAQRWTEIDRYVALAWAIQSEAKPVRDTWLRRDLDELDAALDSFPYPTTLAP